METNEFDSRKGNLVVGAMLVVVGAAIMADRAGLVAWTGMWSLWPLILGGIGLAKFIGTPAGEPKQGLLMLTGAAWLFLGEGGWISLADSWPIVVIALGLIIALNGGPRRRWRAPVPPLPPDPANPWRPRHPRHPRTLGPLAVVGIWIAIVVALRVSGAPAGTVSSLTDPSSNGVHVVSVFGRAEHTSRAIPFEGAEVMNMFGRSENRPARRDAGTRRTPAAAGSLGLRGRRGARAADVDCGHRSHLGVRRSGRRAATPQRR